MAGAKAVIVTTAGHAGVPLVPLAEVLVRSSDVL